MVTESEGCSVMQSLSSILETGNISDYCCKTFPPVAHWQCPIYTSHIHVISFPPSVCLCLFAYLSVRPSIRISVCLSVCLSIPSLSGSTRIMNRVVVAIYQKKKMVYTLFFKLPSESDWSSSFNCSHSHMYAATLLQFTQTQRCRASPKIYFAYTCTFTVRWN